MGEVFKSKLPFDVSKVPNESVTSFLFKLLTKYLPVVGEKPWLVDTLSEKKVLFKDVESRAKRVASALARRGFGHGDFLFMVSRDFVDMGILQLAVWMLGGATRSSAEETSEELARQMKEIKCKFVAVDANTASSVRKALSLIDFQCSIINFETFGVRNEIKFEDLAVDNGSAFPSEVTIDPKEDTLFICNTSGTTGVPKGAIRSHYSILVLLAIATDNWTAPLVESQMIISNNYTISSTMTALLSLATGNIMYSTGFFVKENIFEDILKYKPTKVMMYPYIAGWFARSPQLKKGDFTFVKKIGIGGSVLDTTTVELVENCIPGVIHDQAYASSECLVVSRTRNGKTNAPFLHVSPEGEKLVSSGFLHPLVEAKITDLETCALLGHNKLGKLHIRSEQNMKGYLVAGKGIDRSSFDNDGWFDTGDMAFFDDYDQLFVRERVSFVFKYKTHRIIPSEIDAVLQEHPSVQMSCVIGVPNSATNYLTKALVVLKEGKSASQEELIQMVARKMPTHKHLHGGLEIVESLPKNRGGKLDRVAVWKEHCKRI